MNELLPPQYVNIRSDAVYSLDLSDPLCRTYIRLAGLAWKDKLGKQHNLPPLHEDVLCKVLGLKRASLWGQLQALKKHQLITWTSQDGIFSIRILPKPAERVQSFGFSINDDVDDLKQNLDSDSPTSSTRLNPVQNFGLVEALAEWGIASESPEAQRILAISAVTPDLIHAWGEYLKVGRNPDLVPILLAYQLEHSTQPPRKEKRGGVRAKTAGAKQPALPLETPTELPQSVQDDLAMIGWSGLADDVIRAWQQDAARVQAWLDYAIGLPSHQVKINRAALFRSGIRSNQSPPYRIPRRTLETHTTTSSWDDNNNEEADDVPVFPWPEADFTTRQQWQLALAQLQADMPKSTFETYLQDTVAVGFDHQSGIFTIGAPNAYLCDWLDGRLSSTIKRLLTGIKNRSIEVRIICPEMEVTQCGS